MPEGKQLQGGPGHAPRFFLNLCALFYIMTTFGQKNFVLTLDLLSGWLIEAYMLIPEVTFCKHYFSKEFHQP